MDTKRFDQVEKWLFRIHFSILGTGFMFFGILYILKDEIETLARLFSDIIVVFFFSVGLSIIISIVQMIRYLTYYKGKTALGIKRSVSVLLTSPISAVLYWLLLFILLLSVSSCS